MSIREVKVCLLGVSSLGSIGCGRLRRYLHRAWLPCCVCTFTRTLELGRAV